MEYTYYKTVQLDEAGNEVKPLSIHRASKNFNTTERYDHSAGKWLPNPNLIAATGIGGDNPYIEISEKEAIAVVKQLVQAIKDKRATDS